MAEQQKTKTPYEVKVEKLEAQIEELGRKLQHLYGVNTPPYLDEAMKSCQDGLYKLQNSLKNLVDRFDKFASERFVEVLSLEEVKAIVKASGINHKNLADALNTDMSVVSRILSGEKHKDSLPMYNKIKATCVKFMETQKTNG